MYHLVSFLCQKFLGYSNLPFSNELHNHFSNAKITILGF